MTSMPPMCRICTRKEHFPFAVRPYSQKRGVPCWNPTCSSSRSSKEEPAMTNSSRYPLIGAVAFASLLALGGLGCERHETTSRTPDGDVKVQTEVDKSDSDAEANADVRKND